MGSLVKTIRREATTCHKTCNSCSTLWLCQPLGVSSSEFKIWIFRNLNGHKNDLDSAYTSKLLAFQFLGYNDHLLNFFFLLNSWRSYWNHSPWFWQRHWWHSLMVRVTSCLRQLDKSNCYVSSRRWLLSGQRRNWLFCKSYQNKVNKWLRNNINHRSKLSSYNTLRCNLNSIPPVCITE